MNSCHTNHVGDSLELVSVFWHQHIWSEIIIKWLLASWPATIFLKLAWHFKLVGLAHTGWSSLPGNANFNPAISLHGYDSAIATLHSVAYSKCDIFILFIILSSINKLPSSSEKLCSVKKYVWKLCFKWWKLMWKKFLLCINRKL